MKHSEHLSSDIAESIHAIIGVIPDFPKPGILFRDVSPLLRDANAFGHVVKTLCAALPKSTAYIAGVESRGFTFGAAMAIQMGVGFVPIRKAGKLPGRVDRESYGLEYGDAVLELQVNTFKPGDTVCIVDDLLATGGTAEASAVLCRRQGAVIEGFSFAIELCDLKGNERLSSIAPVHSVFSY